MKKLMVIWRIQGRIFVKNLISIIVLTLLSTLVFSQPQSIGLTCISTNENPMMFNVDLQNERASYFDLASNNWKPFEYVSVRLEELVLMPKSIYGKEYLLTGSGDIRGYWKIHVDRVTLEWFTLVTVNFDDNDFSTKRNGSCSLHESSEIENIARREYDRLNNIRAF